MRHYYLNDDCSGEHYAVSHNFIDNGKILLQVQEKGIQSRICISIEDAEHIVKLLQENINKIKK